MRAACGAGAMVPPRYAPYRPPGRRSAPPPRAGPAGGPLRAPAPIAAASAAADASPQAGGQLGLAWARQVLVAHGQVSGVEEWRTLSVDAVQRLLELAPLKPLQELLSSLRRAPFYFHLFCSA